MLQYHRTTEKEKYMISEWQYEESYSIYNNIPYMEQMKNHRGFANRQNNYYSYYDGEKLVGYINLKETESNIFLGVGVHPQYCGKGYGQQIVKMACELSHKQYPAKKVAIDSANYSDWEGRILLYGGDFKVNKREIHRKEKICFILQKKTVNK